MAVQYHTHIFEIPVASDAEVAAGVISDKVVVPSTLASLFNSAGVSYGYPTVSDAELANIPVPVHAVSVFGNATVDDGLGGLYIDTNNGSSDTFVSGDGRTWYRAADVGVDRLTSANLKEIASVDPGTAGKALLGSETVDNAYSALTTAVWTSTVTRTMKERATYVAYSGDFDVDPTGGNDSTTAIQKMVDETAARAEFSPGTFSIVDTVHADRHVDFSGRGKIVGGAGRRRTTIQNLANGNPLFTFGDVASTLDGLDITLRNMSFVGNALTTEGVVILGDTDDGLSQASRGVRVDDIRISGVGAGSAFRVSAWRSIVKGLEIESCLRGVEIGGHVYATHFDGLYVIGATNEALYIPATVNPSDSNCIKFTNPVFQRCGAAGQIVLINGGGNIVMDAVYTEVPDNAATAVLRIGSGSRSVNVNGLMFSKGSSTATIDIVDTQGQGVIVENMLVFGDVRSYAKISGTLPYTRIESVQHPSGTVTVSGGIDDTSTRKVTVTRNVGGTIGRDMPQVIRCLTTQNGIEIRDSATDAVQFFVQNGNIYMGADTTVPFLQRAGTTVSLKQGAGEANFLAGRVTQRPGIATIITPTNNGDLTIEATSNTEAKIVLRGSDGVVRKGSIILS